MEGEVFKFRIENMKLDKKLKDLEEKNVLNK